MQIASHARGSVSVPAAPGDGPHLGVEEVLRCRDLVPGVQYMEEAMAMGFGVPGAGSGGAGCRLVSAAPAKGCTAAAGGPWRVCRREGR